MQTKTLQSAAATGNGTTLNVTDDDVCLFDGARSRAEGDGYSAANKA